MPMSPRLLRPRASGGFTPKNISGLGLWLDASNTSSLTFNGNTVSEWRDLSGNGRHYSQSTAAQQPNGTGRTQNSRRVLDFSEGQGLAGNAAARTIARDIGGITILAACKTDNVSTVPPSGGLRMFFFASNNAVSSRSALFVQTFPFEFRVGGRRLDADAFSSVGGAVTSSASVLSGVIDYTNSDAFVFLNGTSLASNTSFLTTGNTQDTDSGATAVGASTDANGSVTGNQLDGFIGEVCVYPRALNSQERLTVERYLGAKWGITVA